MCFLSTCPSWQCQPAMASFHVLAGIRGPPAAVRATGLEICRQSGRAPRGWFAASGFMEGLTPLLNSAPRNCARADPDVPSAWSRSVIPLAISQRKKTTGLDTRPLPVRCRSHWRHDDMSNHASRSFFRETFAPAVGLLDIPALPASAQFCRDGHGYR